MNNSCLHPYIKLTDNIVNQSENITEYYSQPIISIEDALARGEENHLYKVVHNEKDLDTSKDEDIC